MTPAFIHWRRGFITGAAIGWGVGTLLGLSLPEILTWLG